MYETRRLTDCPAAADFLFQLPLGACGVNTIHSYSHTLCQVISKFSLNIETESVILKNCPKNNKVRKERKNMMTFCQFLFLLISSRRVLTEYQRGFGRCDFLASHLQYHNVRSLITPSI